MYYASALSKRIIGAAIEVHRELGPGLLESAYQACLARELIIQRLPFEREKPLPVVYKGVRVDCGYRLDFVVASKVIVELKAVQLIHPIHQAQVLTYLQLSGHRLGLLINFNVKVLKDGVKRLIL
jgi:GxxExxY protein